ncbi:MAG: ABC transporter permease subunit [Anaerolineae bacterium]|jgi:multiple sugar transport system permease protein|nr:ABC transporter permease subunit [Anaerolineae bacterium]
MSQMSAQVVSGLRHWFSGRRRRRIRESANAYLFVLPAFAVIGMFGLFPLVFSVYVSLHRWRIIPGPYLGLENFVRAIDNLTYVVGLWLPILLVYLAVRTLLAIKQEAREHKDMPWLWAVPALVVAGGIYQFIIFAIRLLPEVLDIAEKVKGQQRTQQLFVSLLGEAWQEPAVQSARTTTLLILLLGAALAFGVGRLRLTGVRGSSYFARLVIVLLLIGTAAAIGWLTLTTIRGIYASAAETGDVVSIWPQILAISGGVVALIAVSVVSRRLGFPGRTTTLLSLGGGLLAIGLKFLVDTGNASVLDIALILGGVVLLFLSWRSWQEIQKRTSIGGVVGWLLASIAMMLGAWALIAELPRVIRAGYATWWEGLLNTVYYSMFTVPIQLFIGLFLAILLFQKIKAKGLFRLIYFLPYVTNPVAAAGIFRVLFSSRVNAPLNRLLDIFGVEPLMWLDQPKGIFQTLLPSLDLPQALSGPSLALIVICIYGIWSFAGYNTVVFLAGLGSIPTPLYEAAAIDGAGRWQQFRHVTLPLLSPTTYFLTLISVIGTFKAFSHIWVLRSGAALGTTDTASIVIFTEFNRNTRYGYASAMALILMGFILVLTLINNRIAEEKVFYG